MTPRTGCDSVRRMTFDQVAVITLDGKTHQVSSRAAITIGVQTGTIGSVMYADPADPNNIITAEGRTSFQTSQVAGHRYTCNCGIGYDAADADLDGTGKWDQAQVVNCPNC